LKIEGLDEYTAICKIHTKKGITEPDAWRHILLESVLGSSVLIADIVRSFVEDEKVGIVGSEELYFSGPKFVEKNRRSVDRIVHAIFPRASLPRDWGFFAGTMFWIRPSALVELSHVAGKVLRFEQDNSANDGQVAHALERVFGLIALLQGRKIGLVGASDDGAGPHKLHIFDSPPSPKTEEPVRYLKRRGGELRGRIFVPGKSGERPFS
jgi:lipopolysaccharide biosynthesis protein